MFLASCVFVFCFMGCRDARENDTTDGALDTSTTTLVPGSILNAVGRDERKRSDALSAKN